MTWRWSLRYRAERSPLSLSREARAGVRLAQEVEAFLSGASGEWLLARGRDVPVWAYVNRVAHAEPDLLSQLAARAPEEEFDCFSWRAAVALLAKETLQAGDGDPGAIRRIQLDRLMALESQLMEGNESDVAPAQLLALGRSFLRDHQD